MKQPIAFKAEFHPALQDGLGYIRYRRLAEGEHVARTMRVSQDVLIDFDSNEEVLGMELLALDETALAVARTCATEFDLALPDFLAPRAVPAT